MLPAATNALGLRRACSALARVLHSACMHAMHVCVHCSILQAQGLPHGLYELRVPLSW